MDSHGERSPDLPAWGIVGSILTRSGEPVYWGAIDITSKERGYMQASKVKKPTMPTGHGRDDRAWRKYYDAIERFRDRWYDDYSGGYRPVRSGSPSFGRYNLTRDGVNTPGSYNNGSTVSRIIKERASEPYLLGIELEIERADNTQRIADALNQYLPERHVCVTDGSLRNNGIEIVTSPLAPREVSRIAWYQLLRSLSRSGCISHDSGRCGLHISISRSFLTDQSWRSLRSFLTRERLFFEAISRRERGENADGDPFYYCQFRNEATKYTALNLSKGSVAEFRFFRGTLKPDSFLASIEIVRSLVEYTKGIELARERGKRSRFTCKGWISVLSQFPVGWKYAKDRIELLGTGSGGSAVARRRLTDIERIERTVVALLSYRSNGPRIQWSRDTLGTGIDLMINDPWGYSIVYNLYDGGRGADRTYTMPINWERSNVPTAIRGYAQRGYAPQRIHVTTGAVLYPDRQYEAIMMYSRGGWGRRSRVEIRIVEARQQANN